jgi:hypothetical protein
LDNWKKEAEKSETEIHIVIIKKYIDEAGDWLYPPPPIPEIQQEDEENSTLEQLE